MRELHISADPRAGLTAAYTPTRPLLIRLRRTKAEEATQQGAVNLEVDPVLPLCPRREYFHTPSPPTYSLSRSCGLLAWCTEAI